MQRSLGDLQDLVLEHAPVGIAVVTGRELRYRLANPAYLRMAGVGPEIVGRTVSGVFPDAEPAALALLADVLHHGRPATAHELPMPNIPGPDGGPSYWEVKHLPLREEGRVAGVLILCQNVSEQVLARRAAEERAREARWARQVQEAIMHHVPHGLTVAAAPDARILQVSDFSLEMLKQPREALEGRSLLESVPAWQLHHPDGRLASNEERPLIRAIRHGESVRAEEWLLRDGEGREVWSLTSGGPIRDEHGGIVGGVIAWNDITRQKNIEYALRQGERRFRLALVLSRTAAFQLDVDLRYVWMVNSQFFADGDFFIGKTLGQVFKAEGAAAAEAFLRRVMDEGRPGRLRTRLCPRDRDAPLWVELSAEPLRDGDNRIVGLTCASTNVEEHVRTVETLQRLQQTLELALDAASMGDWDYDPRTQRVHHTASLNKLYGLPAEAGADHASLYLARVHPDDLPGLIASTEAAHREADQVQQEFRILMPEGQARWLMSRARIDRDGSGALTRVTGVVADLTAQKQAQALLERTNRELEQFAYAASHDLKEPLRTVLGFVSLLESRLGPRLAPAERGFLDHIAAGARRMESLVNGLLEYARSEHAEEQSQRVDLEELLGEVLEQLRVALEESEAQVSHDPLPTVPGYRALLAHVLQNLISNAVKFRSQAPPRIHLAATCAGREWVISIRDNGIGVPPDQQQRIFEPFTRLGGASGAPGSGLGLALVKKLVERHGGRIWLSSRPGQGSTFYFSLPLSAP